MAHLLLHRVHYAPDSDSESEPEPEPLESLKSLVWGDSEECVFDFTCPGCQRRGCCGDVEALCPMEYSNFFTFTCGACRGLFITEQRKPLGGPLGEEPQLIAEAVDDPALGDLAFRLPVQRIAGVVPDFIHAKGVWLRRDSDAPATPEEFGAARRAAAGRGRAEPVDNAAAALIAVRGEPQDDSEPPDMRFAVPCDSYNLLAPAVPYPAFFAPKLEVSDYITLESGDRAWFSGD